MRFHNRQQAAEELAKVLDDYRGQDIVVYALPRGGVLLGKVIAEKLHAPLDLLIPRKIGHPTMEEYAIAAVTEFGAIIENSAEVAIVDPAWFRTEVQKQRQEAKRRREKYLQNRSQAEVSGKTAIIVDDGIATGLTMKAAITDLKRLHPSRIVIAVPIAPQDTIKELETLVDKVIVIEKPFIFLGAIGSYYDSFEQVSDEEVVKLMAN